MTSDDTPSIDRLIADLRARRDLVAHRVAEAGLGELAELGTVEITIAELDQLLARLEDYEAEIITHEFVAGTHARQTRRTAAMIEALEQATSGQAGTLADSITGILRNR